MRGQREVTARELLSSNVRRARLCPYRGIMFVACALTAMTVMWGALSITPSNPFPGHARHVRHRIRAHCLAVMLRSRPFDAHGARANSAARLSTAQHVPRENLPPLREVAGRRIGRRTESQRRRVGSWAPPGMTDWLDVDHLGLPLFGCSTSLDQECHSGYLAERLSRHIHVLRSRHSRLAGVRQACRRLWICAVTTRRIASR